MWILLLTCLVDVNLSLYDGHHRILIIEPCVCLYVECHVLDSSDLRCSVLVYRLRIPRQHWKFSTVVRTESSSSQVYGIKYWYLRAFNWPALGLFGIHGDGRLRSGDPVLRFAELQSENLATAQRLYRTVFRLWLRVWKFNLQTWH